MEGSIDRLEGLHITAKKESGAAQLWKDSIWI
jgi:hypothetical protein